MSRYASIHNSPNGPGDGRPTALQIVKDDFLEGALSDKVIFLVGASAGIGIETGRAFAATGARVLLGGRNVEKTTQACSSFLSPGRVEVVQIDTSSFASIRKAVSEVFSKTDKLNVLVNNAGVMAVPELRKSEDGYESQLATNYLGPFLTYALLEKTLLASATPEFPSRVVNVSSSAHHESKVHFENINLEGEGEYTPIKAYGQSKTAMIHMTNQIERLYGKENLHGLAVMPGGIMTNLQQHFPTDLRASWEKDPDIVKGLKNPEQGAATTVLAAVGKEWQGRGGRYLEDCHDAVTFDTPPKIGARGYAKHAYDQADEEKLWWESQKWVGQKTLK